MDYRRRNTRGEFMRGLTSGRDMRRGRRDGNDYNDRAYVPYVREFDGRYNGRTNSRRDYPMEYGDVERYDNTRRYYGSPYYIRGELGRIDDYRSNGRSDYNRGYDANSDYRGRMDYGYDYADGKEMSEGEMKQWHEDLIHEIPEQYRNLYKKEGVENIAKQMNVDFKDFSPLTLAVTATMLASDYKDVIAPSDIQRYVALAKAFLCDEDSDLRYGEKLTVYYDNIVNG